jgi:hypothetical protein
MAKVKVWNDNLKNLDPKTGKPLPHVEVFKGETLTIPAGECIEMDWEEAMEFKGQFFPMVLRGDGTHDPKGFKMIRVERPAEPVVKEANVLHATGQVASNPAELLALAKAYASLHPEAVVKDEQAESNASEIAALKAQIEELKALMTGAGAQKGPGRPRKEASA